MKRLILILGTTISLVTGAAEPVVLHVDAQQGNDKADGSAERPFRTANRARDAIRQLKQSDMFPTEGVVVELSGVFEGNTDGINLGLDDGGLSKGAPVVYMASSRGATFLGARRLSAEGFRPVTNGAVLKRLRPEARGKVLAFDLKQVGLAKFSELPRQFEAWRYEELYSGTRTMTLARYPNSGWLEIESVTDHGWRADGKVKPGGGGCAIRPGTFVYQPDDAFARWDVSNRIYMHGYWCWEWSTETLVVDAIDPVKREVRLGAIHRYGIGCPWKNYTQKRRYYVYNLLDELDAPGEWYIDRPSATLYYYPDEAGLADLKLAVRKTPIVKMTGTKFATLKGVQLLYSGERFVELTDAEDCVITGCEVGYGSAGGIRIVGGERVTLRDSHVHHLGFYGVYVNGGDRKTLTKCDHRITGCEITNAGRRIMNGGVCINMTGCGVRVDHNYLHDTPYIAVTYGGNEQLIEYNEIAFAMMEAGDGGGLYSGRDWSSQGNIVRYNYLHHFGEAGFKRKLEIGEKPEFEPLKIQKHGMLMGVYLDDCDSGDTVSNNLFYAAGCGIFVGGGRDNKMRDNLVMAYTTAAYLDSRGRSQADVINLKPGADPDANNGYNFLAKLERYDYLNEPWASRYPHLKDILEREPLWPIGTEFTGNVAVGCDAFFRPNSFPTSEDAKKRLIIRDNIELPASLLEGVDPKKVQDLPEFRRAAPNFPRIPVEEIGLARPLAVAGYPSGRGVVNGSRRAVSMAWQGAVDEGVLP